MENTTIWDTLNMTESFNNTVPVPEPAILKAVFSGTSILLQVLVMVGMGTITTVQDVWYHLRTPTGIFIALASQFGLLPLCAFGLINVLQLGPVHSLSAMIVSCCPGGSSSNLFTYICDGDVPLSIVLTTISTTVAIGMMPLNLRIYSRSWQIADLQVPYKGIAITLTWILIPFFIGMAIKVWVPKVAPIIAKVSSILGMILIWVAILLQYLLYPDAFSQSWQLWLLAIAIPTAGFIAGYLLAFICRQTHKRCRTIALETGMQSISLALTIIVTSFPVELHYLLTPFPGMYGIYLNVSGMLLALVVRIRSSLHKKKVDITPKTQVVSSITK